MYKAITAALIIILFFVIALNVYTIRQQEQKPTPILQPPLPSVVPTTDNPRVVNREKDQKIEYQKAQVEIKNFTAIPNVLTIKTNTVVTWKNFDKDPHQIVGDKWESRILNEKDRFSQSFEKPGNFLYKDPNNPQLSGVVIVEE